jgi:3-oxoacyl-[acyl-carrier protein] reductase
VAQDSKIIIVSGGSRGLGKGFVETMVEAGYKVYSFSRSQTPFVESLMASSKLFSWEPLDGTDFAGVDDFVKRVFEKEKRIDALINNAGMAIDGVLTLMRPEDISAVIALNLEGCIRLARAATKFMLQEKGGSIINISSIIGIRGYSGLAVYSATKAGLDGFTRAMAREVGGRGIRVNSVAPGYLETEMSSTLGETQRMQIIRRTPLGRLGKVSDVTGLVKFLVSEESRFITGQTFVVDGGITC